MKKSTLVALILGVLGGVFFALGMCMSLMPEWGVTHQGVVAGVIGLVILLIDLIVWRRMEGKAPIRFSGRTLGAIALGILGTLLLGVGMCLTMLLSNLVLGVIIGVVGIVLLLLLIPLTKKQAA